MLDLICLKMIKCDTKEREKKLVNFARKYFWLFLLVVPVIAFAAQQAPNMRGNGSSGRNSASVQDGGNVPAKQRSGVVSRSATNSGGRGTVAVRSATPARAAAQQSRSAVKSRAATVDNTKATKSVARSAVVRGNNSKTPVARSATTKARATAVYNDVSKIGGGYTDCHDSYSTCMDQFCANANDTYRRCFCSDKFMDFRDTADALDRAITMLAEFQDNNLNAVDKTAAEVNAMYSASEGEAAIKRDTSASQKLLDSIDKILSGKKSATSFKRSDSSTSLGVLDLSSFSTASDGDIWGGSSSIFDGGSGNSNLSEMEGKELYTNANKQCVEVTRTACPSDAMFNLARSAYSILITQDCNVYEKNINAKKESVKETVRTAERYLREARLEEYRAHNSADVNACLAKVESAIKEPTACGPNYEKCLDYTGKYINTVTGEPIYSQALFEMNNLIVLNGTSTDVLGANKSFNKFLEEKKIYAATALDACRDISDTVWYEFKRAALIQIAQAQDSKIQAVKDSCVATIRECYDKQTGDLNELDTTEFAATGAISAVAARGMCYDRVMACAALYGDQDGCVYDDKSKKLTPAANKVCGLQSLLTFVDAVDAVKVAEGCEVSLRKYAHELCDPVASAGDDEDDVNNQYPMGCKNTSRQELRAAMEERARLFCATDLVVNDKSNTIRDGDVSAFNLEVVNRVIKDIFDELGLAFSHGCEYTGGKWLDKDTAAYTPNVEDLNSEYYRKYYGVAVTNPSDLAKLPKDVGGQSEQGWCIVDTSVKLRCLEQGSLAHYDENMNDCVLSDEWYSSRCHSLGGTYSGSSCEISDVSTLEELLAQ